MISKEIFEYNNRQFDLMLYFIEAYKNKKISLREVVDKLESLINALENLKESDRDDFFTFWGTLEDTYSVMLYHSKTEKDLSAEEHLLIDKGLKKVSAKIKELKNADIKLVQ